MERSQAFAIENPSEWPKTSGRRLPPGDQQPTLNREFQQFLAADPSASPGARDAGLVRVESLSAHSPSCPVAPEASAENLPPLSGEERSEAAAPTKAFAAAGSNSTWVRSRGLESIISRKAQRVKTSGFKHRSSGMRCCKFGQAEIGKLLAHESPNIVSFLEYVADHG